MFGEEQYKAELPNGNLTDFLKSMNEEKASYAESETEGLDEIIPPTPEYNEEDFSGGYSGEGDYNGGGYDGGPYQDEKITVSPELASLSADFAAMMTDLALPSLIALFVKCDPEKLQATQDQYDKLVQAYSQYLQVKQIQLTPGWMLIGVVCSIYATKIPTALKERELKDREDELKRREEELNERLKNLENPIEDADGSTAE